MDIQAVIKDLRSSEKGISNEEAAKRRSLYGLNELPQAKKTAVIKLFFEQFKDILILILIIVIIISSLWAKILILMLFKISS